MMESQAAVRDLKSHDDARSDPRESSGPSAVLERLRRTIDHVAHLLPAQGPISVFIHHNTLHAFEDLHFDEALQRGAQLFGNEPYLPESEFREALMQGRIRSTELEQVLREDLGEQADAVVAGLAQRFQLRFAMLQYPVWSGSSDEMRWLIEETDSLRRLRPEASAANRLRITGETRRWVMRDLRGCGTDNDDEPSSVDIPDWLRDLMRRHAEASFESWSDEKWDELTLELLWNICCDGLHFAPAPMAPTPPMRHRDLLLAVTDADSDLLVNEFMVRYCAAFLDQGFAQFPLPERERGFFQAFVRLFGDAIGPPQRWLNGLSSELRRIEKESLSSLELIQESLADLGVEESEWDAFLTATVLSLRGWGGMYRQVEQRADRVAKPIPAGSLVDLVAVRLLLDRWALRHIAYSQLGHRGPLSGLRSRLRASYPQPETFDTNRRAFQIFMLAQVLGWTPPELFALDREAWNGLIQEVEQFCDRERRRIFHLAFELRFRVRTLDAIALHADRNAEASAVPRFQTISCIDEREESFRRHLEEIAPEVETFGAAGFFGVPMYYRGATDAHFVPLCPIVIPPKHWVTEQVDDSLEQLHQQRSKTRQKLGKAAHHVHVGSRNFARGAMVAGFFGVFASVPLVARILFPRLSGRIRSWFGRYLQSPPVTRLKLERSCPEPGTENGALGYTVEEMTAMLERLLRDIGLVRRFARFVFIIGHGSTSLNNPHESAHDCGACGGARGGPNARAFAQMANDSRIRRELVSRGLTIPDETVFVGGYHNTCDDALSFFDVDRVPESHQAEFIRARDALNKAREWNAHERCRRFETAPLSLTSEAALRHVEGRAEDLAQVRPEYGHATNAVCIVGRRQRTRDLFLDRRSFLVSYDPTQDDADGAILARILGAVVPVCSGINLEYYFSRVDASGWGCGTKLPHNITSLLGVMDGAASDLRTGLPLQMVEIHDPVRLIYVLEAEVDAVRRILDKNPAIGRIFLNEWSQLAVLDPRSDRIEVLRQGRFEVYRPTARELPRRASSLDWYRGWRDHLEFAEIGNGRHSDGRRPADDRK